MVQLNNTKVVSRKKKKKNLDQSSNVHAMLIGQKSKYNRL